MWMVLLQYLGVVLLLALFAGVLLWALVGDLLDMLMRQEESR